jgi:peptidoglycan/LPS O-acetylase OafA/YrhL
MVAANAQGSAIVGGATGLILALARLPAPKILTGLGAISYSLYLTHVPVGGRVVNLGRRLGLEGGLSELSLSLLGLAVSLLFAWVFYKLFEVPATALAHRLSLRHRVAPAIEVAAVRQSEAG